MKFQFGPKNYTSAYDNISNNTHRNDAIRLLSRTDPDLIPLINFFYLNQQSLNDINSALERIKEHTGRDDTMDELLSSEPPQPADHSREPAPYNLGGSMHASFPFSDDFESHIMDTLMDDTPEVEPISAEVMNYKMAERYIIRYRDDFERLLNSCYSDVKKLCNSGNHNDLHALLSDNEWMKDFLADKNGELGILAIKNGHPQILEEIYITSPNIKNYLQNFLNEAADNSQLPCVQYLLGQGANPLPLLEGSKYYGNVDLIDVFTGYLSTQPGMAEQSDYYKGMLKYHNKQFQEAIPFFEHVTSSDLSQHALFYKGCCYQYLLDTAEAMKCFQSLSDDPALNNSDPHLADDVQKHKEAIQHRATNIGKYAEHQGNVDIMLQNIEHNNILKALLFNDPRFIPTVQDFMNKIREHVDDLGVTTRFKELKQLLAEIKYARIKKTVQDEVVVAEEFKDVAVIYDQLTTQLTFDKQQYTDYIGALTILDNTLALIGEVSQGMIVDD